MFGFFKHIAERKAAIAAEELANRKASWDVEAEPMTDKEVAGFMEWAWKHVKEERGSLFQNGALRYMRPGVADFICIAYKYAPRLVALARKGMNQEAPAPAVVADNVVAFTRRGNPNDTSDLAPELKALFDTPSHHSYEDLKQRYFATLLLLCDASPFVPESERERMELVLEDAIEYHPELTFARDGDTLSLEVL